MRGERGFALVITLLVTAILIAVVTEFMSDVYVATVARQNYVDGQQASILASSGVTGGEKLLQWDLATHPAYSSLLDKWAQPISIDDEKGNLQVTIEEEDGKLDLNTVVGSNGNPTPFYYDACTALLKKEGLSADLLDALGDWLDSDDTPRPGGAETTYYSTLTPPYAAKNGRLDTLDELRLVKGFDSKVLAKLRPFATVYTSNPGVFSAPININTAPADLLAVLTPEMTDSLAARIVEYRKRAPFQSVGELAQVSGMESIYGHLIGNVTVKGSVYHIISRARVNETTRIVEAVVKLGGIQPTVLYWREY